MKSTPLAHDSPHTATADRKIAKGSISWLDQQLRTPGFAKLLEQEHLLLRATETISELLASKSISRSELAERLGTNRANISQRLNGERNLTLRSLADMAWACGARIELHTEPLDREEPVPQKFVVYRGIERSGERRRRRDDDRPSANLTLVG